MCVEIQVRILPSFLRAVHRTRSTSAIAKALHLVSKTQLGVSRNRSRWGVEGKGLLSSNSHRRFWRPIKGNKLAKKKSGLNHWFLNIFIPRHSTIQKKHWFRFKEKTMVVSVGMNPEKTFWKCYLCFLFQNVLVWRALLNTTHDWQAATSLHH